MDKKQAPPNIYEFDAKVLHLIYICNLSRSIYILFCVKEKSLGIFDTREKLLFTRFGVNKPIIVGKQANHP